MHNHSKLFFAFCFPGSPLNCYIFLSIGCALREEATEIQLFFRNTTGVLPISTRLPAHHKAHTRHVRGESAGNVEGDIPLHLGENPFSASRSHSFWATQVLSLKGAPNTVQTNDKKKH
jgi:hypothetical protein